MIRERNAADDGYDSWRVYHELLITQGHVSFNMGGSESLSAKSDIRWRAKGNNPNNTVTAGFKLLLYNE